VLAVEHGEDHVIEAFLSLGEPGGEHRGDNGGVVPEDAAAPCAQHLLAVAVRRGDLGPRRSLARRTRSYVVWEAGLALFALTNTAILLIAIIHPRLL
jgi:hypothetical protein